jgi:hypothetical protein
MARGSSSWVMLAGLALVALYLAGKNGLLAPTGGAAAEPTNPTQPYLWGAGSDLNDLVAARVKSGTTPSTLGGF